MKKPENVKQMEENGADGAKEQQADLVSEEEKNEVSDLDGDEDDQKKSRIQGRNTCRKNVEHAVENMSVKEESEEGERVLEQIGQHNYSKSFLKKDSGHEQRDEKSGVKIEDNAMMFDSCIHFNEGMLKGNGIEEAEVQGEQKEGFPHDKKSPRQWVRGTYKVIKGECSPKK